MLDVVGGFTGRAEVRQIRTHVNIKRERAEKLAKGLRDVAGHLPAGPDRDRLDAAAGLLELELEK